MKIFCLEARGNENLHIISFSLLIFEFSETRQLGDRVFYWAVLMVI